MSLRVDSNHITHSTFHTPDVIRTREEAEKVFWGLKDRAYLQVMDYKHTKVHGPLVFDKGLHGGAKEPGFLESMQKGLEFASGHLTEKLTVQFYKELHKVLCAHFKGNKNETQMTAEKTGQFRNIDANFRPSIDDRPEVIEHYLIAELGQCNTEKMTDEKVLEYIEGFFCAYQMRNSCTDGWIEEQIAKYRQQKNIGQSISQRYQAARKSVRDWEKAWDEKLEKLNAYISEVSRELGIENFVKIKRMGQRIHVSYVCSSPELLEKIVQTLFDRYNQRIEGKSALEIRREIACLFQLLELLHPVEDGQGRTDLVLLAMQLSRFKGLNPAVLDEPFTSSWSLLPEWEEDLAKGIELWKQLV